MHTIMTICRQQRQYNNSLGKNVEIYNMFLYTVRLFQTVRQGTTIKITMNDELLDTKQIVLVFRGLGI